MGGELAGELDGELESEGTVAEVEFEFVELLRRKRNGFDGKRYSGKEY